MGPLFDTYRGVVRQSRGQFLKTSVCSPCLRPGRSSRGRPRPNRRSSPGSIAEGSSRNARARGRLLGNPTVPDNTRVAAVYHRALSGYFAIWLIDVARNLATPFSLESERSMAPAWSPDSARLYFASTSRNEQIFSKAADDANAERVLSSPGKVIAPLDVSRDGMYLLGALSDSAGTPGRKLMYSTVGKDDWRPLLGSNFREQYGAFSPDGKWVAYQSNEAGARGNLAHRLSRRQKKHRISERGGREPRWRADGEELFYVSGDDMLMAAAIGPDLGSVRSIPLFRAGPFPASEGWHYAVTSDGQKFLVQVGRPDQSRTLHVVFNWPQIVHQGR